MVCRAWFDHHLLVVAVVMLLQAVERVAILVSVLDCAQMLTIDLFYLLQFLLLLFLSAHTGCFVLH